MTPAKISVSSARGKEYDSFVLDHTGIPLHACVLPDPDRQDTKYIFGVRHEQNKAGLVVLASDYVVFRYYGEVTNEVGVGPGIDTIIDVLRISDNKMVGSVDVAHDALR